MASGIGSKTRRLIVKAGFALAGLVVVAMAGFGLMFWIDGNDINNFCQEASPGLAVAELPALAARHHVRLKPVARDASGVVTLLAHTRRSYGRHTCLVRHDGKVVIERRVDYAD